MRITHRRRRLSAALFAMVLTAGCTASQAAAGQDKPAKPTTSTTTPAPVAQPAAEPVALQPSAPRQSPGVIASGQRDAPYNYAPTVLLDGGRYRMWWCSQLGIANPPGDDILLSESTSIHGPFTGPDGSAATPVFSGSGGNFDAMHTCDPSVIKVGGTYYMYYTGAAGDHAHGNGIGLATSPNGRVWTRANGGNPLVAASRNVGRANTYGAGQPAALHVAGRFYLMFTDTTGQASGHNGAGQFVLRSPDPAFGRDVEALTENGFEPAEDTSSRKRSVVDAFSADWMWVDALAAFAIAHETRDGTTITFWDWDFRSTPYQPLLVPGPWREGPGLVRRADGHAVAAVDNPCGKVPVDLVRATVEASAGPSNLMHFGLDVGGFDACADPGRAVMALNGFAMPSPQRTIDLVVGGQVVRIERRSVAERLAIRILDERLPVLDELEVATHIGPRVQARETPGRGVAFVVDHRLWPVGAADVAALNSSDLRPMTVAEWDDYERGVDLFGPPR